MPLTHTPLSKPSSVTIEIVELFSEYFGVDPDELNEGTDLVEDFDVKGDLEGFAKFVQAINRHFEVDLKIQNIVEDIDEENIKTLGDFITLVEEAQLD